MMAITLLGTPREPTVRDGSREPHDPNLWRASELEGPAPAGGNDSPDDSQVPICDCSYFPDQEIHHRKAFDLGESQRSELRVDRPTSRRGSPIPIATKVTGTPLYLPVMVRKPRSDASSNGLGSESRKLANRRRRTGSHTVTIRFATCPRLTETGECCIQLRRGGRERS